MTTASPEYPPRKSELSARESSSRPAVSKESRPPGESELRGQLTQCWPDLYRRALRLSRNEDIARDVLQDTFERALRFECQYEPNSNLRAWLHRILISVFVTRCRRLRRERRALEMLTFDPCAWTSAEPVGAKPALSPSIERAVATLPDAFRKAVELVDMAEMSYRDAADILGVPLGTVMSRLHRGRRMLADALREREETPPEVPEAA